MFAWFVSNCHFCGITFSTITANQLLELYFAEKSKNTIVFINLFSIQRKGIMNLTLNNRLFMLFIALVVSVAGQTLHAQWTKGVTYLGAHVGLINEENAFMYGIDIEHAISKPNELGPGQLGVGIAIDRASFTKSLKDAVTDNTSTFTTMPIQAYATYHIGAMIENRTLDPYIMVGFAFTMRSISTVNNRFNQEFSSSTNNTDFIGGVGIRYFLDRNLAIHARLGFGPVLGLVGVSYGMNIF
jgi:hypothetical protein